LDSTVTNGDGEFSIFATAQGIPQSATEVEDFIEIHYLPDGNTETIVLDDLPWGQSTMKDLGSFTFQWTPGEPNVGEIDGRGYDSVQSFANQLAEVLSLAQPKPYSARSSNIVLLREASQFKEFTQAQDLTSEVNKPARSKEYAENLHKRLENTPVLRTRMKYAHDAHLNYLYKIAAMQSYQFERGTFLKDLVLVIGRSLGLIIEGPVSDPIPDAAACALMIYIAGRMAKDGGKVTSLKFGKRAFSWTTAHDVKTVEVTVGR
jgi:hypothetical protein